MYETEHIGSSLPSHLSTGMSNEFHVWVPSHDCILSVKLQWE